MHDVIIVGGGIAGITAAIYASRKRMDYLLITKTVGGQVYESGKILNYPGIPEVDGASFAEALDKQLRLNNIKPRAQEEVKKIEKINGDFSVTTDKGNYESKTIVIATGSKPRKLNVPGEKEFARKGVAYCSICDGPLFAGKDIAIIGGGNSALEGVDFTQKIARKIYVINLNNVFTAHESLVEKAKSYENVSCVCGARTTEIIGDKFVTGIKYEKDNKLNELKVQGIIIEIGRMPNTEFLGNFLNLDSHKHIAIDCQSKTSVEGVFAAGDCASGHEYQYIIAAGQGCIALLKAARYSAHKK